MKNLLLIFISCLIISVPVHAKHIYLEKVYQKKFCNSLKTGKQAGIVLIIENQEKDLKELNKLKQLAEKYNIKLWTMRPADLK